MKFIVTRTSWQEDYIQPCDNAVRELVMWTDIRYADSPNKIPAYATKETSWWYDHGSNHRLIEIDGKMCIARDTGKRYIWTIELDSLDALTDFIDTCEQVVLMNNENLGMYELEIYDDYRE